MCVTRTTTKQKHFLSKLLHCATVKSLICDRVSRHQPFYMVGLQWHQDSKSRVFDFDYLANVVKPYYNGDRYRAMITNVFIPELNNVQELWFQQDGATCHTARATIDLLKDTFGDRLISRFGLQDLVI
ncbi:hypothetical protein TNCV_1996441 [Trichonephila clavipes]|uniref:Transposase n=1 Tax=Trichonephila clavipes TaxID=2585209 RepID=A0A8X6RXS6_TRICX|nr:hypothetical protein TNCV_1996441 [Trichonephila clavipes]